MNLSNLVPEARRFPSPIPGIVYLPALHSILESFEDSDALRVKKSNLDMQFYRLGLLEEDLHQFGIAEDCNSVLRVEEYVINHGFYAMLRSGRIADSGFSRYVIETAIPATLAREALLDKVCVMIRDVIEPFHFLVLRTLDGDRQAPNYGWTTKSLEIYLKASENRMNASQLAVLEIARKSSGKKFTELYQKFVWSPIWSLDLDRLAQFNTSLELFTQAIASTASPQSVQDTYPPPPPEPEGIWTEDLSRKLEILEQGPKQRRREQREAPVFRILSTNDHCTFLLNPTCRAFMGTEERQIHFEFVLTSFIRYSIESAFRSSDKETLLDLIEFASHFVPAYHESVSMVSMYDREKVRKRRTMKLARLPLSAILSVLPPTPIIMTRSLQSSPRQELNFEFAYFGTLSLFKRNRTYSYEEYSKSQFGDSSGRNADPTEGDSP